MEGQRAGRGGTAFADLSKRDMIKSGHALIESPAQSSLTRRSRYAMFPDYDHLCSISENV